MVLFGLKRPTTMDVRYLNFPVAQIPFIFADRENAMEEIISYALVSLTHRGFSIEEAGNFLGIFPSANFEETVRQARRCANNSKSQTSIRKDLAFDFRDHQKSTFDTLCLCANLAIRRIVGKRHYLLCRKDLIFSRMSGVDSVINKRFYKPYVKPLDGPNGRRRWDKVRDILRFKYGVAFYAPPGCRGFYVSYILSEENLAINVEKMIMRKRNRKKSQSELHMAALQALGRTT